MNDRAPHGGEAQGGSLGGMQEERTEQFGRIASSEGVAAGLEAALAEIRAGDPDDIVETGLSGALEAWQTRGADS